jgi:AP-1-like factor
LQKASEDANNENSALRAKVEQMTNELNQYKKKVSLMTQSSPQSRDKVSSFGNNPLNGFNDLDFQFDFPTFGVPTPPTDKSQRSLSHPISPHQNTPASSAVGKNGSVKSPAQDAFNAQFNEELAKFNNGFTPSMSSSVTNASRASLDSASFSLGGATSSPSASSQSNAGPSSSCGTSPEPVTQSPMGFKPVETLTTIGEEQPTMSTSAQPFTQFSNMNFDNTNFDWLAQQNGGQFDPQLFGDYREPQNNVLANPSFDDFFNDTAENDFFTPFNVPPVPESGLKKNICDVIDAQKDTVHEEPNQVDKANMSCNQIWYVVLCDYFARTLTDNLNREKLQACPNAQNGEFDLDALCSDLTKKAKCSGNGPVVGEADFNTILKKYMGGKDASCVASKLGIEVEKAT